MRSISRFLSRISNIKRILGNGECGVGLVETAVTLAILGAIAIAFLSGLATASRATIITDERATAENLAKNQMEWMRNAAYTYDTATYSVAPIPSGKDYVNYSVTIAAQALSNPDNGIQKITITIMHGSREIIRLESYKVDR